MITLEEAKSLKRGDILHDQWGKRWKVNGEVTRWVRNPDRIRVPLKHGLYAYGAITDNDFIDGKYDGLTFGEPPVGNPHTRSKIAQKGRGA